MSPGEATALDEVASYLTDFEAPSREASYEVLSGRSFAAVRVSGGPIGSAMDYSNYRGTPEPAIFESMSVSGRKIRAGYDSSDKLRSVAVHVAMLSAESRKLYRAEALAACGLAGIKMLYTAERTYPLSSLASKHLRQAIGSARRVGVLGFGGFMEMFSYLPGVERVIVCDADMGHRRQRAQSTFNRINMGLGTDVLRLSDEGVAHLVASCDIVQVTGSILSNGTAAEVLTSLKGKPFIVVGPTAAVAPQFWFHKGATLLCTELRDESFWWSYRFDDHLYDWNTEYADRVWIRRG